MEELDDIALLREFVERDSEAAFASLVSRHIDKVYSVALRHTRNPHLAQEITQAVFVTLVRKARRLSRKVILSGWLYQTARLTAVTYIRGEIRRSRREQEALMQTPVNENEPDVWPQMAPLLDTAMAELSEADRHAVVLRFLDGKSMREVGAALGATENAAKMRVSRSLEKLRQFFGKRGIALSAVAIAGALAANSVQAAPAGMSSAVSAAALAASSGGTGATLGFLKLLTMTKLQTTIIGAAVVTAAVVMPLALHDAKLRQENQTLRLQLTQTKADNDGLSSQIARAIARSKIQSPLPPAAASTNSPSLKSFQEVEAFVVSHGSKLPREQIEAYLQKNHRNVESLLAAYQMSHDPTYLREATTNAPNSPAVLFAVVANNVFPDEQRKWIDAFKTASPENALPWYFSAFDYFKSNQPDQAFQELAMASRRQIYSGYASQTIQAVEEMYDSAGWPGLASKACAPGTAVSSVSYVDMLKSLANDTVQAQQSYTSQGDTSSAISIASMGVGMASQLRDASRPIDQLVGISIEKKILGQLDPAQNYDFLGCSVSQALAELDQQKQAIQQALQTRDQVRPKLGEQELNDYWEREKLYGEMYAMQWLQSKYPQP